MKKIVTGDSKELSELAGKADVQLNTSVTDVGAITAQAPLLTGNLLSQDTGTDATLVRITEVNGVHTYVNESLVTDFGFVTIHTDGSFTYTLNPYALNWQNLGPNQVGTEQLSYVAMDAEGNSYTHTLTLSIPRSPEDGPASLSTTYLETDVEVTYTGNILLMSGEVKGLDERITAVNGKEVHVNQSIQGFYGTVFIQPNGNFSYTLNTFLPAVSTLGVSQNLADTFTVSMTDETGADRDIRINLAITGTLFMPLMLVSHHENLTVLQHQRETPQNITDISPSSTHTSSKSAEQISRLLAISSASAFGLFFANTALASSNDHAAATTSGSAPTTEGNTPIHLGFANQIGATASSTLTDAHGHTIGAGAPPGTQSEFVITETASLPGLYTGPSLTVMTQPIVNDISTPQGVVNPSNLISNYITGITHHTVTPTVTETATATETPSNVLTANPDSGAVTVYDTLDVPASGVLANDTQTIPLNGLSVSSVGTFTSALGATGTLFADGAYQYDPATSVALLNLPLDQTTQDSFNYTLTDGQGNFAQGIVDLTVTGMMSIPVGTDGADAINGSYSYDVIIGDPGQQGNPAAVGSDIINAGDGNDIIFGDVPNSDALNTPNLGAAGTHDGAGYAALLDYYGSPGQVFDALTDPATALLYNDNTVGAADTIDAGDGHDVIFAGGGDDIITAGLGNDTIHGGLGNDTLIFGDTNMQVDLVSGTALGEGTDIFYDIESVTTGSGSDAIIASASDNTINAGAGVDTLSFAGVNQTINLVMTGVGAGTATGQGNDSFTGIEQLIGSSLNDTFDASASSSNDNFDAGAGTDTISYAAVASSVTVDLFNGQATGVAIGTDTLSNFENAIGGSGDDTLIAGANTASLTGGFGNDTLVSGSGDNTLDGGTGSDWASYANAASAVTINLSSNTATGDGNDILTSIENVIGSSNNDSITGDSNSNILMGGAGNDTITGGTGDDTLLGGTGNNALDGGIGSDWVSYADATVGASVNFFTNTGIADGTDSLISIENVLGSGSNDIFVDSGTTANNIYDGGAGNDTLSYAQSTVAVTANLGTGAATGRGVDTLSNIENLIGGSGNDTLTGDNNDNMLTGGSGADTLTGGDGNDTLMGGIGNDRLTGDAGSDWVSYANAASAVVVNLTTNSATGGDGTDTLSSIENVIGSAFNDTMTAPADAGANTFDAGAGIDTISYAPITTGVTINLFNPLNPQATGVDIGTDTLLNFENAIGGSGDDTFIGDTAANTFTGGVGSDTVDYSSALDGVQANLSTGIVAITGESNDRLFTIENVIGSAFDDTFTDANATNINTFSGGTGNDTISYALSTAAVTVNLNSGPAPGQGSATGRGSDTLFDIENAIGGSGADTFIGDANDNTFTGGTGTDTVDYSANAAGIIATMSAAVAGTGTVTGTGIGTDSLVTMERVLGTSFNDTFTSGIGSETFVGGGGNDILSYANATGPVSITVGALGTGSATGQGTDAFTLISTFTGSDFNDTFLASTSSGNQTFDGGAGIDTVSYASLGAGVPVTVDLLAGTATATSTGTDTLQNIESVIGGAGADTLIGNANTVSLTGGSGNDTLIGGSGDNTLTGGTGTDTVDYSANAAGIIATMSAAVAGTGTVTGTGIGTDSLVTMERVLGTSFNDTFTSGIGSETFVGGGGNDILSYANATGPVSITVGALGTGSATGQGTDAFTLISTFTGSDFNDTFLASTSSGNQTFDGGAGIDTVSYASLGAGVPVTVDLLAGTATATSTGTDTLQNIENAIGGAGADTFIGDTNANTFTGGTGNDTVDYSNASGAVQASFVNGIVTIAGEANDKLVTIENIIGSQYNDTFFNSNANVNNAYEGGAGDDTVSYAASTVAITANLTTGIATGRGNDQFSNIENLIGGAGNDRLTGDNNANMLAGGSGNDTLIGGSGDDTLLGGAGNDSLIGDGGSDWASFADATAGITANLATGTATGDGTDILTSIENVLGSDFADTLIADIGTVSMVGGAGDDTLFSSAGDNNLDGGTGSDWASYVNAAGAVTVNLFTNSATGDGSDTLINIENVIGSANNDTITGDDEVNILMGGAGSDIISGGGGDDTLMGGTGNNTLSGDAGSDWVSYADATVGATVNFFTNTGSANGTDTLISIENVLGSSYDDTFTDSGTGTDNIYDGGAGNDVVSYASSSAAVTANLSTGIATGQGNDTLSYIENLIGGTGKDTFTGDSNDNLLDGGANNDTLTGGGGNDTLIGGLGNDILSGGTDSDWVSYTGASTGVVVNLTTGHVTGGDGTDTIDTIENVIGSSYDDTITALADTGANTFDAGVGNDTISYDPIASSVTIDLRLGQATGVAIGNDALLNFENAIGGDGDDTFIGNTSTNTFTGGSGNDTVDYTYALGGINVSMSSGNVSITGEFNDQLSSIENVTGSAYDDTIIDANANTSNVYDGGSGINSLSYQLASAAITANLQTGVVLGRGTDNISNIQNITTGSGNDTITAAADGIANTFDAGTGTDTISYAGIAGAVSINLITGLATGTDIGTDTLLNFENVTGGLGDDTFISNADDNEITGGGGIDWVSYANATGSVTVDLDAGSATGDGDDSLNGISNILGGAYDDTFVDDATNTSNIYSGGSGLDTISYAEANASSPVVVNLLAGTAIGLGSDTLTSIENAIGGSGDDTLIGNANTQFLTGGAGDDVLVSGGGGSTLDGGTGSNDWVSYANATTGVTVNLSLNQATGYGTDTLVSIAHVIGSGNNDTFINANSTANNTYVGGAGVDTLDYSLASAAITVDLNAGTVSGRGNDKISDLENITTGSGKDTIVAAEDSIANSFDAGANIDTISYANVSSSVTVNLITGLATGTGIGTDTLLNFENVIGGLGDDTFISNAGDNEITGGGGTDWVSYAFASSGVNVDLSNGNVTGDGNDSLSGISNVLGGDYNDTFVNANNTNDNVYSGGAGIDTVSYEKAGSGAPVVVNLLAGTATGRGNDTLISMENAVGGSGADTLIANANTTSLDGGGGVDTLVAGAGDSTLDGGSGSDWASYANATAGVTVDLFNNLASGYGNDTLVSIENVQGGSGDDLIISSNTTAANTYDGGAGVDTLSYEFASAKITANLNTGTITGRGTDTVSNIENLTGGTGADTFTGDSADNVFIGGSGNDTLIGGAGDDTLVGGIGTDRLQGDDGNDLLIFDNITDTLLGGADTDTLRAVGVDVDLTSISNTSITGIERIDLLTDPGAHTLTLNLSEVINTTSDINGTLLVSGGADDAVVSTDTWVVGGTTTVDGHDYNTYTSGGATLLVDIDMINTGIIT